jgi:hypothetical protein
MPAIYMAQLNSVAPLPGTVLFSKIASWPPSPAKTRKGHITFCFAQALSGGMGVKKRGANRLPASKTRTIPGVSGIKA